MTVPCTYESGREVSLSEVSILFLQKWLSSHRKAINTTTRSRLNLTGTVFVSIFVALATRFVCYFITREQHCVRVINDERLFAAGCVVSRGTVGATY